jgi:hypothetical protein
MKAKGIQIRVEELKSLLMLSANKIIGVDDMMQGAGELSPNLLFFNIQNNITESLYPTSAMPIHIDTLQLYYQKTPSYVGAIGFSTKDANLVVDDNYTKSCLHSDIIVNRKADINIYYIGLSLSWSCDSDAHDEAQIKLLLGVVCRLI